MIELGLDSALHIAHRHLTPRRATPPRGLCFIRVGDSPDAECHQIGWLAGRGRARVLAAQPVSMAPIQWNHALDHNIKCTVLFYSHPPPPAI